MDFIGYDTFLLLVLLILVGIVLFLSLVTTIYVTRFSKRIADLEKTVEGFVKHSSSHALSKSVAEAGTVTPIPAAAAPAKEVVQEVAASPQPAERKKFDVGTDAPDIPSGMKNLCTLYDLDSLTVSSPDGLVIASSGHPSAITEAAQFSYAFLTGAPITEEGVHVFPVDFHAHPLVGIYRSSGSFQDSSLDSLKKDLEKILEKWI